jgi:hypothetical protein
MCRARLQIRSLLLLIAVLAFALAACVLLARRVAYCHERADFYEASANTIEIHARFAAKTTSMGLDPGWASVDRYNAAAVEWRRRSARFRVAAWRPWLRLPVEASPTGPTQPLLPCPDDNTDNRPPP